MSYTKPHISDITSDNINYIDEVEKADNYIDWVTYEVKNSEDFPEYNEYTFSLEDNNNVAATSQENLFTNENQNDIDILAASGEFYNENYNDTSFLIDQSTICAENLSREVNMDGAPEDIKNETYTDDLRKRIKELNLQKEELEQKKSLLQNEKQELELKIKKEQEYVEFRKQSEQQDNTMNKNNSNEPKNTDEEEPQNDIINEKEEPLDNMRNVKQKEHASEKLYSRNPNYEQYNKEHYDKDLEDLIEEANNRLWGKDKKKYRKEECQIKEQEKFTIDEEPTDNMRNIKNNKTLEINEYEKGCFNISYT